MASFIASTSGVIANAASLGPGIQKALAGHPERVSILDPATSSVIMQFSAVVDETHSRESPPTQYPLEDGQTISDHIIVAPFELQLNGVVTDTPLASSADSYKTEGVATAYDAVLPALGLVTAISAYSLHSAGSQSTSPSKAAYAQLLRLQAGDPTANPPQPPKPFDVKTALFRYPSMVIKSLSVPRNAQTGKALYFTLTLTQLLIVSPQTVNIQIFNKGAIGAKKAGLGEQPVEKDPYFTKGRNGLRSQTGTALLPEDG